jgi:nicotinate-nucleotide adenylyltransferase
MNKVILLGGSFDPPHLGHMIMAQWAAEQLGAQVRFLPTGTPPHKHPLSPSNHRLEMLKLSLGDNADFLIDDYELRRCGVDYTVNTLKRYHGDFGIDKSDLYFVIGSDSLNNLPKWKDPKEVAKLATLLVFEREAIDIKGLEKMQISMDLKVIVCKAPIVAISSFLIRERVRLGKSIRYLVHESVREYISDRGLYLEGN